MLAICSGIAIPSAFANCGNPIEQTAAVAFKTLPASVQRLAEEIKGKTDDEIETAIIKRFGPGRDVGSGVRIELWDIDSGVLSHSRGLVRFQAKGRTVWLTQTVNKARPTLTAETFEMYTLPEPQMKYWIGNLSLNPAFGFKFIDSDESLDHRANQTHNFFMKHPVGRYTIQFAAGCSADTVLERLPDATFLCTLTFFPADGTPQTSHDIIAYPSERRLAFSTKKRPLVFLMDKGW
jgi:hypothetical protein